MADEGERLLKLEAPELDECLPMVLDHEASMNQNQDISILSNDNPFESEPLIDNEDPEEIRPGVKQGMITFLLGVNLGQFANGSLRVIVPLVLLSHALSHGNASTTAFLDAGLTAADCLGNIMGAWLASRVPGVGILVVAQFLRGIVISIAALLFSSLTGHVWGIAWGNINLGTWNLWVAGTLYTIDAFSRGLTDTMRSTFPAYFVGKDKPKLEKFIAKYQFCFELGNLLGPVVIGFLLVSPSSTIIAAWIPAVMFIFSGICFVLIPPVKDDKTSLVQKGKTGKSAMGESVRIIIKNPWVSISVIGLCTLQWHCLKGLVPAVTAAKLLNYTPSAGWMTATFGVAGLIGSIILNQMPKSFSNSKLLNLTYAGLVLFAWGWLPSFLIRAFPAVSWLPFAATIFIYNVMSVMARVAIRAEMLSHIPAGYRGTVTGIFRATVHFVNIFLRVVVGLCFVVAEQKPFESFFIFGATATVLGLVQLYISWKFTILKKDDAGNIYTDKDTKA